MYANDPDFGGEMMKVVEREFQSCKNVSIASGYVSYDVLSMFQDEFYRIASDGGVSRLLLGMAFYEGLSKKKLELLEDMHSELLKSKNGSGIFVVYSRKYHGKIYSFGSKAAQNYYVGSSNFSRSGLIGNLECTALVKDARTRNKIEKYLDYLFSDTNSKVITDVEITVPGSKEYKDKIKRETLSDLERYDPDTIDKKKLKSFDLSLARIADKEKSNLNAYFGKGRLNTATGKVNPRPWYEVEMIADRSVNSNPLYPMGDFLAYTDDGYIIPMKTSGDYHKNMRSKGGLQILGQWIKGKLQSAEALVPLTLITRDTLEIYGNDTIQFYKIKKGEYYMEFKVGD